MLHLDPVPNAKIYTRSPCSVFHQLTLIFQKKSPTSEADDVGELKNNKYYEKLHDANIGLPRCT